MVRRTIGLVCIVCALGVAQAAASNETRAPSSTLSELVADSDTIVHGRPIQLVLRQDATGFAVVQVLAWLKGAPDNGGASPDDAVTVQWDARAPSQSLGTVETEWVLFLSRTEDGAYVGTQPDRSFWPLRLTERADRLATLYRYPVTLVRMPDASLTREMTFFSEFGEPRQIAAIALEALADWIAHAPAPVIGDRH